MRFPASVMISPFSLRRWTSSTSASGLESRWKRLVKGELRDGKLKDLTWNTGEVAANQ